MHQLPLFDDLPLCLSLIRNHYWHLRAVRPHQQAQRRFHYRRVERIRSLLLSRGVDAEFLRLYCRALASLSPLAIEKLNDYVRQKIPEFESFRLS